MKHFKKVAEQIIKADATPWRGLVPPLYVSD